MPAPEGTARRALVVDDSRTMRKILGRVLAQFGFTVAEAGDGREALSRLDETDGAGFDLALVDWNMPVMNGYELVCTVRANRAWSAMPLIMVTTESDLSHVQRALEAGADEYMMKPFTPEMLEEKLILLGIAS